MGLQRNGERGQRDGFRDIGRRAAAEVENAAAAPEGEANAATREDGPRCGAVGFAQGARPCDTLCDTGGAGPVGRPARVITLRIHMFFCCHGQGAGIPC